MRDRTETEKIVAMLEQDKIYEFSASRTVEILENGEVDYNRDGLYRRIFKNAQHFAEWLNTDYDQESVMPIREYFYNDEKSDIAGYEVWEDQNGNTEVSEEINSNEVDEHSSEKSRENELASFDEKVDESIQDTER